MNFIKTCSFIALSLLLTACFPSNNSAKNEILLQGKTMGTTYHIKVVSTLDEVNALSLQKKIDDALIQVNQEMSTYIPDSELSRFNKNTSTEPVVVSQGLARVIKESIRLGKISNGKLDVTVGPLVNLWGFGPEHRPDTVPSDEVLAATQQRIGLQYLSLEGNQLTKSLPELYVDLSTTAKGYGVDVIAELLEINGLQNYLVEIGGEMRLKGFKHTGELWHVAIEKPVSNERSVQQIIVPKDNAIATSGDYRNYFEADGMRFSHIIDPSTGKPINHKLVSVTVIAESSMTADGLSTAMMVMGEDKAYQFAMEHDIAAYIISKTDNGFREQITVKFMPFLK
jgi:thiamine biosynthesis lipoprotein